MATDEERLLLRETISILTSYAWDKKVGLEPTAVGLLNDASERSIQDFAREFHFRHALAAAGSLPSIIDDVEKSPSHESRLARHESRATIRGRLDVPRYLARRVAYRSPPRRYPIVRHEWTYQTPENALACLLIDGLRQVLSNNPFPRSTAEGSHAAAYTHWATDRLRHRPWNELLVIGRSDRLYNETRARVRRRQTGNDTAYARLLSWFEVWNQDLDRLGTDAREHTVEALLALPMGPAFWERVFEVWCLVTVAETLEGLGLKRDVGPLPLHQKSEPVLEFITEDGRRVKVRFQRQDPLPSGRWKYRDGQALRGIPDITLDTPGRSPLIIDAKYRFINSGERFTRSEETYKMLGYAENFNLGAAEGGFRGVLIFPAAHSGHRALDGPNGGRVDLLAVHLTGDRSPALSVLADSVSDWMLHP